MRHERKEGAVLVLTRKVGERIQIGDSIVVTVVRIQNEKVRIGIEAPQDVAIFREEVVRRARTEKAPALTGPAGNDN
jgi:carbon storage regulator